jgi:RNA 2',3'-cyclic 3'-phosphodiesterase
VPRLFVAVWPPDRLMAQLRGIERPARPGLRWTTEDQWHVTLRFLGQMADEDVDGLRAGLAGLARQAVPLAAEAGPRPRALGSGVWVLPVSGLESLAGDVLTATRAIGGEPSPRPFRGHITLARTRERDRARARASLSGLDGPAIRQSWTVDEISLVRSELHPAGARYEAIGRWPLGP